MNIQNWIKSEYVTIIPPPDKTKLCLVLSGGHFFPPSGGRAASLWFPNSNIFRPSLLYQLSWHFSTCFSSQSASCASLSLIFLSISWYMWQRSNWKIASGSLWNYTQYRIYWNSLWFVGQSIIRQRISRNSWCCYEKWIGKPCVCRVASRKRLDVSAPYDMLESQRETRSGSPQC